VRIAPSCPLLPWSATLYRCSGNRLKQQTSSFHAFTACLPSRICIPSSPARDSSRPASRLSLGLCLLPADMPCSPVERCRPKRYEYYPRSFYPCPLSASVTEIPSFPADHPRRKSILPAVPSPPLATLTRKQRLIRLALTYICVPAFSVRSHITAVSRLVSSLREFPNSVFGFECQPGIPRFLALWIDRSHHLLHLGQAPPSARCYLPLNLGYALHVVRGDVTLR